MAYQRVATPRFYLNTVEYLGNLNEVGHPNTAWGPLFPHLDKVYRTLPVGDYFRDWTFNPSQPSDHNSMNIGVTEGIFDEYSFMAVLGHTQYQTALLAKGIEDSPNFFYVVSWEDQINCLQSSVWLVCPESGFHIATFDGTGATSFIPQMDKATEVGSVIIGTYYDVPHSPDLNLSLSYEYEGINEITTRTGASFSNAIYTKPNRWLHRKVHSGPGGDWNPTHYEYENGEEIGSGAFELFQNRLEAIRGKDYSKSGRRVWDLNFSYLSDSDIFPEHAGMQTENLNDTTTTMLMKSNTLQRAIHLTRGGEIPFIFCSDKDNPTADNHAIAMFDNKSFRFSQVANGVYNVKLKIREVW